MTEKIWTWSEKKDYKKAVELEEYIKEYTVNKIIGVIENTDEVNKSILIEKIKEEMENDND